MVSNYSTRVNKTSEINEATSSSLRSTITTLNQELVINEKTVEEAINLISTIKSQQQVQINQEMSFSSSTATLNREAASSDSSEKLNEYVVVTKEEAAEAPVDEPAAIVESTDRLEEEDNEINSIADAIQAITTEMKKSTLVADTIVVRETSVQEQEQEQLASEKKRYTSNMESVLERIKETLEETQQFLAESANQSVIYEETSVTTISESNNERGSIGKIIAIN